MSCKWLITKLLPSARKPQHICQVQDLHFTRPPTLRHVFFKKLCCRITADHLVYRIFQRSRLELCTQSDFVPGTREEVAHGESFTGKPDVCIDRLVERHTQASKQYCNKPVASQPPSPSQVWTTTYTLPYSRAAHQIEQLPRLLFLQPLAFPLIVHMFHELFQEDQSGQASDPSAIDGQKPHRRLVHCSGRAPIVKDPQGFAQVEQRCKL
jgi:hypothetical protein